MMRTLVKVLFAILFLLVLTVGAVTTLTVSEPGSRWLVGKVLKLLPGEARVAAIHGRLISGLNLDGVDYQLEQTTVHADRLVLRWQPAELLRGTLRIEQLLLDGVSITPGAAPADSPAFIPPERIALPLAIDIRELRIAQLQVNTGDAPTRIESLALSARAGPLRGLAVRDFTLRMQDSRAQLSGRATLRMPYAFKAKLDWQTLLPDGVAAAGRGDLDGDLSRIHVAHTLSQPFEVSTTGSVRLDDKAPLLDLDGHWRQIQWPLRGAAEYSSEHGDYSFAGTLTDYRLTLSGPLAGRDIPSGQVQASGTGDARSIRVESLQLDTLGGTASASGTLAWEPNFTLALSTSGKQLDPGMRYPTGHARFDLDTQLEVDSNARNTVVALRNLDLNGSLQGHALSASGALIFTDGVPSTPGLVVNSGPNQARVSGSLDASGMRFSVAAPQLTTLLPGLDGSLRAQGRLIGPLERLTGEVTLTAEGLEYGDKRADRLRASARVAAGKTRSGKLELVVEDAAVGTTPVERLTLDADGTLADHAATLNVTSAQGGARVHAQGAHLDNTWTGNLDTATLSPAEAGTWQLREAVALRVDSQTVAPFEACWTSDGREVCLQADWHDDSARLRLAATSAEGHAHGDITVSALHDTRPRLVGQINADIPDILFLNSLLPDDRITAGRVVAQAKLSGYLDAPQITGSATLTGGEFKVAELGLDITAISLQAQARGQQVELSGSAQSGKGAVRLDGKLGLDPQRHWPFDLTLRGERFSISQRPDMQITANPDLQLQGSATTSGITGKVLIPYARITLKKLPPEVVKVSADQVIVGKAAETGEPKAPTYPLRLNVVTILGDDVHFEGLGLSTDLAGSLNVRSLRSDALFGNGVLELRNGKYEGYGQKLSIEQGRLLFAGPLDNPALDVRATRTVGSVVAGIELYGNADAPQTRLFSTPAMSDAEILSYLVTGKPLGATSGGSDSQALAAAAASLGANSPVAQQINQQLGIELGVQSGATDSETAVVVTKHLSSDLSIDYVYGLFNEQAAIQFIYKLTRHISLTGQSGAAQSIDLNFSIDRP